MLNEKEGVKKTKPSEFSVTCQVCGTEVNASFAWVHKDGSIKCIACGGKHINLLRRQDLWRQKSEK